MRIKLSNFVMHSCTCVTLLFASFLINSQIFFLTAMKLPSISYDASEVAIASLIERSFSSNALHVVLFLMGHQALTYMPQMPFLMIKNDSKILAQWKDIGNKWFRSLSHSNFRCRLRNSQKTHFYETRAVFIPNNTTTDPGFNRKLEVLRCPIRFYTPRPTKGRLLVEILRDDLKENSTILFRYYIPWKTRQTGWGFSFRKHSSNFNAWQSTDQLLKPSVIVCSGIIRPRESRRPDTGIPMLLEFIEHNRQLGIYHQFLGLFLDWKSSHMHRILRALSPYISTNDISVTSMSYSGYDDVSGFLGLIFIDDYTRYIHQQQCLYYSKGLADYVSLFHASEFLTLPNPLLPTIQSLIHNTQYSFVTSGKNFPCYFIFQSLGVPDPLDPLKYNNHRGPEEKYWTKDFFKDSKPIGPLPAWITLLVPTRYIWSVAWHVVGSCGVFQDENIDVTRQELLNPSFHSILSRNIYTSVTHEIDGHYFSIDDARMYFYRGHFEPWMYEKPKHNTNQHLIIYGEDTVKRLNNLGYDIQNDLIIYRNRSLSLSNMSNGSNLLTGKQQLYQTGQWLECSKSCRNMMDLLNHL